MNEKEIIESATEQAKQLKKILAKEFTSLDRHPSEDNPISVFMAGSPGAGKTESAKRLVELRGGESGLIHIDPDAIRIHFLGYTGENADLFNKAVSAVQSRIQDDALHRSQSFIMDGTFSSYLTAKKNIEHSLKHGRKIFIIYVYQDPIQAWSFVQARKGIEGRKVPKTKFVNDYFDARITVNRVMQEFQGKISLEIIRKDLGGNDQEYFKGITSIDECISESYSRDSLQELL